jgi:DNA-binding LacI/PurR family transcriptional regulator
MTSLPPTGAPRESNASRVTLKDVARVARVHFSTVSMALRDSPRLTLSNRKRIREIAERLGYRRDPVMLALTAQRSNSRVTLRRPRMAFLTNRVSPEDFYSGAHMRYFLSGAQQQAERMGYTCDLALTGNDEMSAEEFERQLDPSRTDGIIVGAVISHVRLPEVDWSRYATVKIDSAFLLPGAPLIANDQMHTVQTAFQNAHRLGYRRIGMAVGQIDEENTHDLFAAGCYLSLDQLKLPFVPPLHFSPSESHATLVSRLAEWVRAQRIEVVLSNWQSARDLLVAARFRVPADVGYICLNLNDPDPAVAGVIANHFEVGQKAAETLALLIKRGLKSPAHAPSATYVEGVWQDGASATLRHRR